MIDTRNILTRRPEGVTLEQIGKRQPTPVVPQFDGVAFEDGVVVAAPRNDTLPLA